MIPEVKANGLLFIGDVHVTSRPPSRRKDNYVEAIFHKLEQAIEIANQKKLVPVFLGDMFHRAIEPDETIKTRLFRLFGEKCWTTIYANVGNHDKNGTLLSDSDTLAVLAEPKNPIVAHDNSGPMVIVIVGDIRLGLGASAYGHDVPHDANEFFPRGTVDGIIWVTHHDIAFDGAYPGSIDPHPIKGCQVVVNGHMHLEKVPVEVGEDEKTLWCNFGSLTRTAIDALNHEPAVWSLTPSEGLVKHKLSYERDVFTISGDLLTEEARGGSLTSSIKDSLFISMLKEDSGNTPVSWKTSGEEVFSLLMDKLKSMNAEEPVKALAIDLYEKVRAS